MVDNQLNKPGNPVINTQSGENKEDHQEAFNHNSECLIYGLLVSCSTEMPEPAQEAVGEGEPEPVDVEQAAEVEEIDEDDFLSMKAKTFPEWSLCTACSRGCGNGTGVTWIKRLK